jgi:hypothetical protein
VSEFKLTPFQERVLLIPEGFDLFLGGGRGGGKSTTMALLALRHVEQYGKAARVLYLRRTYKGGEDFAAICHDIFGSAYDRARYNAQERLWRFPNGGTVELGQLDGEADYRKYQGRSFTLLMVDEAGQYAEPRVLDRLRSNLRGGRGVPVRMVIAANPGDVGHQWLARRYVFGSSPWQPLDERHSGRQWVHAPSVFTENPTIDQKDYLAQLTASCPADPELLRAWAEGDWAVARGAFFAGVLDEPRNAVEPWDELQNAGAIEGLTLFERNQLARGQNFRHGFGWDYSLAHDFGVSAPSVTYLVGRSPGGEGADGRFYPRGSLVLIDELATVQGENLNQGLGLTVPALAAEIKRFCERWGVPPRGCADDAIFARTGSGAGSIAEEFASHGVRFQPARKADRRTGWEVMRRLLSDAGKPDRPGLYISRSCRYFWATAPYLARDARRPDDIDSNGPDHGVDAVRYACLWKRHAVGLLGLAWPA